MKQCPACKSQYTDDTLKYCLQDGTPLGTFVPDPAEGVWRNTATEEETVVSRRTPDNAVHASSVHEHPAAGVETRRKSRTGLVVFATAIGTLLVLAVLGAGVWILSRGGRSGAARNDANAGISTAGRKPEPTPTFSATPTPTATPASNSVNANSGAVRPPESDQALGSEVTNAIAGWKDDTESLNIDDLMERYDTRVDYYKTPGADRNLVKQDKERAFSKYGSVSFDITNMQITPGRTPDTATAEFDKAWVFEGEERSVGKVRSRLALRKVDGRWLITSERDIKVY